MAVLAIPTITMASLMNISSISWLVQTNGKLASRQFVVGIKNIDGKYRKHGRQSK